MTAFTPPLSPITIGATTYNGAAVTYLSGYLDLALPVRDQETAEDIAKAEQERLRKLLNVATLAGTIPRRLGVDAGPEELAADKTRAKRIAHVAQQCLTSWGGKPHGIGSDANREAAQVEWQRWWPEHRVWLQNRQRYLATWCHKTGANEKWTKSAIVRLENEIKWLEYALR